MSFNGNPFTDLKKMYSSHLLENIHLSKQKSELDLAKANRLQELNNNEKKFLRKYAKYTVPGFRQRRYSSDAVETKKISSRPQSHVVIDKSFGRESVNSECIYSFETWNKLVDSEVSIIEQGKKEILCGDKEKNVSDDNGNSDNTKLGNAQLLHRRHSMKPVAQSSEEEFGSEYSQLQNIKRVQSRGRRHSVALGAIPTMSLPPISYAKLPKIEETTKPSIIRKSASAPESIGALKPEKHVTFDKTFVTAKHRVGRRFSAADIQHSPLVNVEKNVRPTPNATVVIREDPDDEATTKQELSEGNSTLDVELSDKSTILPDLPQSALPSEDSEKKTPNDDVDNCENPSQTRCLSGTVRSPQRKRRGSISVPELKLLVDSHHGAAKLRYITKLANEMEKEERAKQSDNQTEDTYKDLVNCRYLRRVSGIETDESEDGLK